MRRLGLPAAGSFLVPFTAASFCVALFAVVPLTVHAEGAPAPSVFPGSVVRWPGPGATRCTLGGHEVPPVAGECLFAIDLLRASGPITITRERGGASESRRVQVEIAPYPVETITLPDDTYVKLSKKNLARADRERQALGKVFARRTAAHFTLPLSRPLAHAPAGKNFGKKRIFNGEARSPHGGTDYPVPAGTTVLAAADGVVALVDLHFFAGWTVVVDHGGGLFTTAVHLSKALVKLGETVKRGDRLALSGATGRVNGAHLHFAVRWQNARVDPEILFRQPDTFPTIH
ncbi:MAG: M23 family metallopeptidase [Thermoanaerobaculia bacterium]